jgi:predicted nuclease of predicted toxin-antitoxin system
MRFIANENISGTVIRGLREQGHDVLSVKEAMRGQSDEAILTRGQAEGRVVVTQDKDFGELAFRRVLPAACGVVLLRLAGVDPDVDNRRALRVLTSSLDWYGHFTVVTDDRVRVRPLPGPSRAPEGQGGD